MAQGRHSVEVLKSIPACNGRIARNVHFVVWVEFGNGFVELDAENHVHALTLADNWLTTMEGAMSASVRRVNNGGKTWCMRVLSRPDANDDDYGKVV
jgi:hypothetical protein